MRSDSIQVGSYDIKTISLNTVVVGTGAAGYNAADRLAGYGETDIAIVTEDIFAGTSRNTGSDKQTYYKLSLSGDDPDSVRALAENLFAGQCVDGDLALVEAALSTQCFLRLAELGVPFPVNRYGEYIGYKTDHDPRRRATSVGPYTSKWMTESLERSVKQKGIQIYDHLQVVAILTQGERLVGLLCLDLDEARGDKQAFVAFHCKNVVYATGGPAGMYADSVYPLGHYGATGTAFEAGALGKCLTEWQFGMASVAPRWNVSGTYMQVLPKFISTDQQGGDEREFLYDFFTDEGEMLTDVFLKGYQWPFDVRKVAGGSSIIDILVYIECSMKGRRVFLDFRANPQNKAVDFSKLSKEAEEYLRKAGAAFGTPIERLKHMNEPAISFYKDHGVDLYTTPLEIAVCVQHNNGGLAVDKWWQTNIEGLFAVGEASASHGVYRPGGSALNAGQVGSTRAAQYIAQNRKGEPEEQESFPALAKAAIEKAIALKENGQLGESNVHRLWEEATRRMSQVGGCIRNAALMEEARQSTAALLAEFEDVVRASSRQELAKAYRLRDVLVGQYTYLSSMVDYCQKGGKSRGSALYYDPKGQLPYSQLPEGFRFVVDDGSRAGMVQEVAYKDGECSCTWRSVREIPREDDFFENVWRTYRENKNIY